MNSSELGDSKWHLWNLAISIGSGSEAASQCESAISSWLVKSATCAPVPDVVHGLAGGERREGYRGCEFRRERIVAANLAVRGLVRSVHLTRPSCEWAASLERNANLRAYGEPGSASWQLALR